VRERFGTPRGKDVHKGVDFINPQGTCVVASDAGTVVKVNDVAAARRGGNEIVIETVDAGIIVYSHTEKLKGIKKGIRVKEGQPIGRTDYGSGSATGPHLHYQWRSRGAEDYEAPMEHLKNANPYPSGVSCASPTTLSGRKD
jgi:murein DD-endopeptidase MepM/ murein hydrolase activator NlpD